MVKVISRLIHSVLERDVDKIHLLKPLAGKAMQIEVTDLNLKFHFMVLSDQVAVSVEQPVYDFILKARVVDLLQLALSSNPKDVLSAGKIDYEGDVQLLSKVQRLIDALDLDLEQRLARWIGDRPAAVVSKSVQGCRDKAKSWAKKECASWYDYWAYESGIGLSKEEMADFYDDVSEFSMAVDRLSARLNAWSNKAHD